MLGELKRKVYDANMELHRAGLVRLTWGNVSGVDRDRGAFVIKPSGVAYSELKPEHMVAVALDGNPVESALNPSSDSPTHAVLYRAFEGIGGVAHSHSLYATMFAQACREIPCLGTTHADHFYGSVPVTRAMTKAEVEAAYEANTGEVIVERFEELDPAAMPAVLTAHHGPFTWGVDAMDAVRNSIALETVAQTALGTFRLSSEVPGIPGRLLEKHYQRKHGANAYYGQRGPSTLKD
jgi:L-ribulose-5-phosphate 4-epimerase